MYPSFYLSSLLKYYFFELSMRENKREVRVFHSAQSSPILSHTSSSPLCISYFYQILRQRLCDFLI